jgi:TonB-linked SusC/RagA family outer membrane protein
MTKINCSLSFIRNRFTLKLFLLTLFALFMICISSVSSFAQNASNAGSQNRLVSGRVLDAKNQPLAGATVAEKGGKRSVLTTNDGSFKISVSGDGAVLVVSYVGYQTQETAASSGKDIVVQLTASAASLDSVIVVTGYGTQRKTSSTAAISTVKGEELTKSPVANVSNSIAGRVAGVSMRANGGQPGSDNPDIHIRGIATTGNSAPLIVVDGIIRNSINEVDPNAIASVTVLKDAAAVATYGLGGANGVLVITTKRGQTGAPTLSFGGYYGVQQPTYVPKVLNAQDYMRLRNEAYLNENPGSTQLPFAQDLVDNYINLNKEDPDKYPISDAVNTIPHKNSSIGQGDLQISGGTKDIKYFAGIGYFDQKGMFDPVGYKRYTYNINLDVNATSTTTVSFSLNGSNQITKDVDAASSTTQLFRSLYKFIPIANLNYSNGLWGEFAGNSPVGVLHSSGYFRQATNSFLSTIAIEQKLPFITGLSLKGTFSYDPYSYVQKRWHTPFYYYSQDLTTTPYTYTKQISTQEGGAAPYTWLNENYYQNNRFTYQFYLNYHNKFGKHEITGLAVAEEKNNRQLNFGATRNNFAVNIDELSLGSSNRNDFDNSGASSTGSQIGYVYRVSYGYDNRYFLEASGRYDGHYYFAPDKRWAYFPAFSAGWVLSNEKFMQGIASIDYLKLRGSWGKAGNLAGSAFQYLNADTLLGNVYAFGNGNLVQGSYLPREANPNITWEISTKTDIGFEANLWKGLLRLEADYFGEKRTGMLLPPAIIVPQEYGVALSDENAGEMENHGFEISAGTQHTFRNRLRVGLDGNFSYSKNKMVQVYENTVTKNDPQRSRTGRPLNTPFGYHALGLFTTDEDKNKDGVIDSNDGYNITQFGTLHPGDVKYADLGGPNGVPDGKIDSYDETVIGNPVYPSITYGFTASASWMGIDVSLFFQGSALSSFNPNTNGNGFQTIPFNNNNSNAGYEYYKNHWTPEHQHARYPRANQSPYSNNTQASDFWMVGTGYLRLKTATIGYTFPGNLVRGWGMKNLRIYASGQNVFTVSDLKFMDPEVGYTNGQTAYPNQKVFTVGLNASF